MTWCLKNVLLALSVAAGIWSWSVGAETTQDLLIQKLEHVDQNLAPNDASKIPVTLRLADLYSERARTSAMKELETGCTICKAGEADRARALRHYLAALPHTPASSRGRVMIQVGHLYELMGQEKDALGFYQSVVQDQALGEAATEAHLSMAEIQFKKNRFAEAAKDYRVVLADAKAASRGLAAYRLAWCELNLGHFAAGLDQLKAILTTHDLQSKSGVADGQADHQFVEEVSRDYATWMGRMPVALAQIEELGRLSPDSTRQSNLITLASELERTGKKSESALTWKFIEGTASQPEVRLEAKVRLVPLTFVAGDTTPAAKNFAEALMAWQDLKGCGKPDCTELQKVLRGFVINWNQSEKRAPSENLQKSYQLFVRTFPHEAEMAQWGAQVAKDRHDWTVSEELLATAAASWQTQKQDVKLESTLLSALEVAELSKDKALWATAAQNYLALSPTHSKAFEVRYQQARVLYDSGDYKTAQTQLRTLALEPSAPHDLQLQAAHLSLDALNLLKDEANLALEAAHFAKVFTGSAAQEFGEIRFKAVMNNVAKLAESNPVAALEVLKSVDSQSVGQTDRQLYLKNKILLAEKSNQFDLASASVDEYLALNGLSAEDREFAMSKKAWLSELRLDFTTALKATQNLKTTLKPDQKLLKLALYADLSGANSQMFYQQYLSLKSDGDLAVKQAMAAQLVRQAKDPMAELSRQSVLLSRDRDLLARLYTEIYVKNSDAKLLAKILADKRIEGTSWGKSLNRVALLNEIKPLVEKLAGMKVDARHPKSMALTIKARALELSRLEKLAQRAIAQGDWTTQLVSLESLAREDERFYQEILSLPMPEGLSPEEETQYMTLLTQQSSPYKNGAEQAKVKTKELWSTSGWSMALQKSLDEAGEFAPLVNREIEILKTVAEGANKQTLEALQVSKPRDIGQPSREALEQARNEVRRSPIDQQKLKALLELEKQSGNLAMVHYLEERLQGGTNREKTQEKSL